MLLLTMSEKDGGNPQRHGKGCAFTNSIEALIRKSSSPAEAAVDALVVLAKSL
jgi:hydroxymethylpyrimidine/phosphomethylpyrimidine kinase